MRIAGEWEGKGVRERRGGPSRVEFYFGQQEPLKHRGNLSSANRHVCKAAIPAPVSRLGPLTVIEAWEFWTSAVSPHLQLVFIFKLVLSAYEHIRHARHNALALLMNPLPELRSSFPQLW